MNAPADVAKWLAEQERKELLRFITCGSVDDGKSTLIGRLLYDTKQIFDDQLSTLEADSRKHGTQGEGIDFALLVDGLSAEREQGITIDVAYRFFASEKRKFIVADTPGHEQYTRNMVTGASTADLAVLLVDARKGVLTQTRRHSYLAQLIGIRHFVVAVTKMDLVDFDQAAFDAITADYRVFADKIGIADWAAIPVSGLGGDNVGGRSERTPWYGGPSLLEHLDTVPLDMAADAAKPLRLPVQWVNRPDQSFRGFTGQIASGSVGPVAGHTRAAVGTNDADRANCDRRRRPGEGGRGAVGDRDLHARSGLLARRRHCRRGCSAGGRRPVRSDHRLDGRA